MLEKFRPRLTVFARVLALLGMAGFAASAQADSTLTVVASFNNSVSLPAGNLVVDGAGNIYGASDAGGTGGGGVVYEVANGSNKITTIASFTDSNNPVANGVVMGSSGNLYGTTYQGGGDGFGTVFKVANGSDKITTIASFSGSSYNPSGVVMDSSGNLYGTTRYGGTNGYGTVFEVANGSDKITTIASFNGSNGSYPVTSMVLDSSGNLYGTTGSGGANGYGTVFEVANGSNKITTLASFNGTFGAVQLLDGSGNLYGVTFQGGSKGDGSVFEIANGSKTITTLASFDGSNGSSPNGLLLDGAGNLFGTASAGGNADGDGTVFEIANGSTKITTVGLLNSNTTGSDPGGLVLDGSGNLFGTTSSGGNNDDGKVFEVSGAAVPFASVPEPATLVSTGVGLAMVSLAAWARRRRAV